MKLSTLRDEIRESKDAALVLGHDCGPLSPVKMKKRGDQSFQVILRRCSNYTLHSINYSTQHTAIRSVAIKGREATKRLRYVKHVKDLPKLLLLCWNGKVHSLAS